MNAEAKLVSIAVMLANILEKPENIAVNPVYIAESPENHRMMVKVVNILEMLANISHLFVNKPVRLVSNAAMPNMWVRLVNMRASPVYKLVTKVNTMAMWVNNRVKLVNTMDLRANMRAMWANMMVNWVNNSMKLANRHLLVNTY